MTRRGKVEDMEREAYVSQELPLGSPSTPPTSVLMVLKICSSDPEKVLSLSLVDLFDPTLA